MKFGRIIACVAAILIGVEGFIMLAMSWFPPITNLYLAAVVDATLLAIICGPLLFRCAIRPALQTYRMEVGIQQVLNQVLKISHEASPLEERLQNIVKTMVEVSWLNIEPKGCIFISDSSGELHMAAHHNLGEALLSGCRRVALGQCLCGQAAQEKAPVIALHVDSRHTIRPKGITPHGHVVQPILLGDKTLGVLNLYSVAGKAVSPSGRKLIESVSHILAQLISQDADRQRSKMGETLKAIMDHAPFGVWLTDTEGRPQFVNATLCDELGVSLTQLMAAESIGTLFDDHVQAEFSASLGRGMDSDRQRTVFTTVNLEDGPRDLKVTRVTVRTEGIVTGFIGIVDDVTETRRLNERIAYQATHDSLTGLWNRSAFEEKLEHVCKNVSPQDTPHTLAYIDLDQFKIVNDTCGHQAGDELLKQLTNIYRRQLRATESVTDEKGVRLEPALARVGGDEFALLLYNCPMVHATKVAERMINQTKEFTFAFEGRQFHIGCSIGLVEIGADNQGISRVLQQADSACYLAKEKGRGRHHVYRPHDEEIHERQGASQWVPRITEGLITNRFRLYRQPLMPVDSKWGADAPGDRFEVLIRYQDDNNTPIPPGGFLPAAERFGIMPDIDKWVIINTLELLKKQYGDDMSGKLNCAAINLSGQSLGQKWLLDFICQQFARTGVRPEFICFEITETAAIANLNVATRLISQLGDLGCKFALDDFGSGLSSFSYLKQLPVDYLKIDGSLVRGIAEDPVGRQMVTSIHDIAQVMGIQTVAEWVEDEYVLDVLREIGVDYAQGYLMGHPVPMDNEGAPVDVEPVADSDDENKLSHARSSHKVQEPLQVDGPDLGLPDFMLLTTPHPSGDYGDTAPNAVSTDDEQMAEWAAQTPQQSTSDAAPPSPSTQQAEDDLAEFDEAELTEMVDAELVEMPTHDAPAPTQYADLDPSHPDELPDLSELATDTLEALDASMTAPADLADTADELIPQPLPEPASGDDPVENLVERLMTSGDLPTRRSIIDIPAPDPGLPAHTSADLPLPPYPDDDPQGNTNDPTLPTVDELEKHLTEDTIGDLVDQLTLNDGADPDGSSERDP